jgi:hypothetical protein
MMMTMACRKKSENVAHAQDGIKRKKLRIHGTAEFATDRQQNIALRDR